MEGPPLLQVQQELRKIWRGIHRWEYLTCRRNHHDAPQEVFVHLDLDEPKNA